MVVIVDERIIKSGAKFLFYVILHIVRYRPHNMEAIWRIRNKLKKGN